MRICTSLGTATAAAMLLLGVSLPAKSDSVIMSWNLKHIGWGDDKRFDQIAHILGASDLAALQEVMDSESIEKLELQLEAQTGEP
jgi:endonuclease/exonuclease/phosphatase family metal-dependent hydrolase